MLLWNLPGSEMQNFYKKILTSKHEYFYCDKWFVKVFEILKTGSYEPAYHWVEGQKIWKYECTTLLNFFMY